MTFIPGKLLNVDTKPFGEPNIADTLSLFYAISLIYQKIAFYIQNPVYSDKIEELIPLAIVDTLLSCEDTPNHVNRIDIVFGMMKNLTVQYQRNEIKKKCISTPEILGEFKIDELLEMMEIVFNHHRGSDYFLTKFLPAIKMQYNEIGEMLVDFMDLCYKDQVKFPVKFDEILTKMGYKKK